MSLETIFGECGVLLSTDTIQYNDYDKYEHEIFDKKEKIKRHKEVFPEDCRRAFELGARLVSEHMKVLCIKRRAERHIVAECLRLQQVARESAAEAARIEEGRRQPEAETQLLRKRDEKFTELMASAIFAHQPSLLFYQSFY